MPAIASGARRRVGVRTGPRSSSSARAPSGVGVGTCLRPTGRCGAVTMPTRRTSGLVASQRSAGTANAPLPRKVVRTRTGPPAPDVVTGARSREGARRLADLRILVLALADRDQLVHGVEVVDVQLAVEVIQLVLE